MFTNDIKGDNLLYIKYWEVIMPRGKRTYTLEEQLERITNEIENMESSLKQLKSAKQEIEAQIRQNRLAELDELIVLKGLTFEQVKDRLSQ